MKVLHGSMFQPKIIYLSGLLFRTEGDIKKCLSYKQMLKEFIASKSALQETLKGLLLAERESTN